MTEPPAGATSSVANANANVARLVDVSDTEIPRPVSSSSFSAKNVQSMYTRCADGFRAFDSSSPFECEPSRKLPCSPSPLTSADRCLFS